MHSGISYVCVLVVNCIPYHLSDFHKYVLKCEYVNGHVIVWNNTHTIMYLNLEYIYYCQNIGEKMRSHSFECVKQCSPQRNCYYRYQPNISLYDRNKQNLVSFHSFQSRIGPKFVQSTHNWLLSLEYTMPFINIL